MKIKTPTFNLAVYQKGDENSKKLALVLPGKLDTKDYPHMRSHVDFLAEKGYLALSFDPPGTWESDGDISLYTMTNYLKAINELIKHFGDRPTFVIGHSRGGSMSMLAGLDNENITHFGAIMSFYAFDLKTRNEHPDKEWQAKGYKESKRDLPNNPDKFITYKLPYLFQEDQEQYNMLSGLRKCSKPKMFIMGTHDVTVSPEVVQRAYDEASEPKELYQLNSDHDYRLHPQLIDKVNQMIGDFLETTLFKKF